MRHINGVYTQRFNRRHKKEGQLFRGRYKAVLVESDSHLLKVMRYIHRNPLRAGLVKSLNDYGWSSHAGYLSRAKKWAWLHKDDLLAMLVNMKTKNKSAYIDFVLQDDSEEIERFYSLKNLPSIFGDKSFKECIREKFSDVLNHPKIPESKIFAPEAEHVISVVCQFYQISRTELFKSRIGYGNPQQDVAIYLVGNVCRMTLPDVGRAFGIGDYSSVSSIVQRVKLRLGSDNGLRKDLKKLRENAQKSKDDLTPCFPCFLTRCFSV